MERTRLEVNVPVVLCSRGRDQGRLEDYGRCTVPSPAEDIVPDLTWKSSFRKSVYPRDVHLMSGASDSRVSPSLYSLDCP